MGNSATQLQDIIAVTKAQGIPVPTDQPGGHGTTLALAMANDLMSEIIAERFNWKFNRAAAPSFLTNSFQQDYPQLALVNIGWLEDCDKLDINNTAIPKPLNIPGVTVRRALSRTSLATTPVNQLSWMYNKDLSYGTWPGASVTFYPLITTIAKQNPLMSMVDANGNLLILTTFGTTGNSAPLAAANAVEGTTVADGSCVWTVVAPMSQGFRVFPLPGANGPVYQMTVYYQVLLQKMTALTSLINPIPEEYKRVFQRGFDIRCKMSSPNPTDKADGLKDYPLWIKEMEKMIGQGNREADSYGMYPSTQVVENVYDPWRGMRNPQDPSQPF